MIDLLNSLYRALPVLGEMSLTAAYAAAVVAVLRMILKKRAPKQVLCVLWLVVFARLLIPVNLESPLSILPDQEQVQAVQDLPAMLIGGGQAAPEQNPGQIPVQGQPGSPAANPVSQENVKPDAPALSLPGGVTPSAPRDEAPAGFPWQALLAGVWLAGALAMGLYGIISCLRLKRRLFDAIRSQDGAWEHPAVGSPFILGVIRPKIYLPAGLCGQPRQFILCHERAHLRRLDHIVKPLCWAALALHWFNPAVWLAFVLMSRDIEAACDEAVIRRLGPKVKADYSATLLALATGGRMPAPCPLAFDEGNAKGRIQNVLRYRRPALWIVVVSVVMAVMAAVCLLTDPVSAQEPDENPDPSASQSQAPEGDGVLDPWMVEILAGRQNFTSADTGENVNIDLLNGAYPYDVPYDAITLSKFNVVDLDRDGLNELVLCSTDEQKYQLGSLILLRQGDAVYSYNPSYRSFYQLKADGTFSWSGGTGYHGTCSARFTENGFEIEKITWCEVLSADNGAYFVDGLKATEEEFAAAIAAQNAKPEPVWYVFEDGILKYAPINVPIPLDEYAQATVPDFLDEDQQLLYHQALVMYAHIFGATSESADSWPGHPGSYGGKEPVDYNGSRYWPATGLYSRWSDFEEAVLSVFTQDFWKSRNEQAAYSTYVNIDGVMHYLDWARGSGGYNDNFPPTFRLVERTDDTISFIMTGYYSDSRQFYGIASDEEIAAWLSAGWEYSIEFPMRMVRTERGWRFDEFHSARTDNGLLEFSSQMVSNPNPPAAPSPLDNVSAPEDGTASTEPVVLSELDGMQLVSVGNGYRLNWQGQSFPVGPDGVSDEYPGFEGWLEDFDEDGQPEALFYGREDGSYPFTIYDFVNNVLVGYPCPDIVTTVYPAISASSVAAYNPATGGLTMTFPWGEGDNRRYVSIHTTLSSDFFEGCEELADGRPLRMNVQMGSINGMFVPRGFSYRARITLTDGTIISPEVGYMWFGIRYSDSGFEIRTPEESDFGTDYPA